jgi:2,4-dienoyl-CoA reductase-like NADH-dependent reductase (Old Yellow Enzyme family)/thioredoxin reductase
MNKVFEPIQINRLTLKNRMVVSAMVTLYANADGTANEKFIAYHEEKAKGGWGLIITEDYIINPTAGGYDRLPGLYKDEQIESHRALTDRVHAAGGHIFAQIYHAGRETSSDVTGVQPVAPSPIKDHVMPEIPRELTKAEIEELVEQFGDCALRVKKAGFDGVELHGAHGYLIGQFVSPVSNKRTDEYGGTIYGRAKFALDIVKNVRQKVGPDFPVTYRMSTVEYVDGGLGINEAKALAMMLEEAGIDAIHCSQGVYGSMHVIIAPSIVPNGYYIDNAAEIKKVVNIPVIAVGGRVNDPALAEEILRSGKADMVTMGRASLADPALPKKAADGRREDIIHCIGCLQGCTGGISTGAVRCLVNPMTGMEDVYSWNTVTNPKRVFVAGGGVAGCEAAIVAAKRGHQVTLFEQSNQLGGQWLAAAIPNGKTEFTTFVKWQTEQLSKLGVDVKLNMSLTREKLLEENPDALIVATGSCARVPKIAGANQDYVVLANEVLLGKKSIGEKIVIVGGGLVGCETAEFLASHGKQVTVIEMMDDIVRDGEPSPMYYLRKNLKKQNVTVYTQTKVVSLENHTVSCEKDGQQFVLDGIDHVVIAIGAVANDTLSKVTDFSGLVIPVGDAKQARNGLMAIREGFEAGMTI